MFAYCENNPTNKTDFGGNVSTTNVMMYDGGGGSAKNNSKTTTDYVIYYYCDNSSKNLDACAKEQKYTRAPVYVAVATADDFINAMNHIPSSVNNVYIYTHGSFSGLELYQETLSSNEIAGKIRGSQISGSIYLFACHGAYVSESLAIASGKDVYASKHGVSFQDGLARNSWKWVLLGAKNPSLNGWFVSHSNGVSESYSYSFYFKGNTP